MGFSPEVSFFGRYFFLFFSLLCLLLVVIIIFSAYFCFLLALLGDFNFFSPHLIPSFFFYSYLRPHLRTRPSCYIRIWISFILNLHSLRSVSCVKRGPSGLRKGEEQELEGKPPFVLFLAMCSSQETTSYKLVVRWCYHYYYFWVFFLGCNVALQRGQQQHLAHCCFCAILKWRGGQWQQQRLACRFFFLLRCSLQAKRREREDAPSASSSFFFFATTFCEEDDDNTYHIIVFFFLLQCSS